MRRLDMEKTDTVATGQICALIAEFHMQTGIPVNDILAFYKKIAAVNAQFALDVMREELKTHIHIRYKL
jgi:hypothetical protein